MKIFETNNTQNFSGDYIKDSNPWLYTVKGKVHTDINTFAIDFYNTLLMSGWNQHKFIQVP